MSNVSMETTTQIVRVSDSQSSASGSQFGNIGGRSQRGITTVSDIGRGVGGANVVNRNRATSNLDGASDLGSEYSEFQPRRVDFDASSMGGESTQIVRQIGNFKGGKVNNYQNANDDKEGYLYNDEDENESHNNYNYYKDNKDTEDNGS
jgi:hypothetical protein